MSLSLITNEWRLKLLALALAILMLGAVAFSQNRPTTKTLTVGLNYTVPTGPNGPNIILLNPPGKTAVTYSGLADVISRVDPSNLIATVDATGARPGTAVKLNVTARSLLGGVQVQNPPPIAVNIDTFQYIDIPVQVVARPATGWRIDPKNTRATCPGAASANPCKVRYGGPVSWEAGLKAVATVPNAVSGSGDFLNQPLQLQTPIGGVDLSSRTSPQTTTDVTSADVHVEAIAGTTSQSVALVDSQPSRPPPQGYRVTGVVITPLIVTITGDSTVLQRIDRIVLPAVDLSGSTQDVSFPVAIPYPNGVSGSVANATVKYSISRNPNVSPSP
jgi:YbbR domain-containing protein